MYLDPLLPQAAQDALSRVPANPGQCQDLSPNPQAVTVCCASSHGSAERAILCQAILGQCTFGSTHFYHCQG